MLIVARPPKATKPRPLPPELLSSVSDSNADRPSLTAASTLPMVPTEGGSEVRASRPVRRRGVEGGSARTCMEEVTSCTNRMTAATMPNSTATDTSCKE